jgi:hypothetical protein
MNLDELPGSARLMTALRWGKVLDVRKGKRRLSEVQAVQWLADIEDTSGSIIKHCLVMGARSPIIHSEARPSFAIWGTLGGSIQDPWCLPCPWTSAPIGQHADHELLDEYTGVALIVHDDGTFQIRTRPDDAPLLITKAGSFHMLGGAARMARGPSGDSFDNGDVVAIDGWTSPAFAAWITQVTEYLRVLVEWAKAQPQPCPFVPPPPTPALTTPQDIIPAVDDMPERAPGDGPQLVGRIVTGSPRTRGS